MGSVIQKRTQIVRQAIANQRLEGLKISAETRRIASDYVAGKISAKNAAAKIRAAAHV